MTATLKLDQLAVRRGGRLILTGINLEVGPGEAVRLAGANGVGKSSLIRVLAGLIWPYTGSAEVQGGTALADEGLALESERALADALRFWARLDGGDCAAAMEAMGLAPLAPVPVRLLSTGQRKRAALARVIASGAEIWLLDEPGNGLDDEGLERLTHAIEAHRAKGGIVVFASHFSPVLKDCRTIDLADYVPAETEL